jgi:hypothetical protein
LLDTDYGVKRLRRFNLTSHQIDVLVWLRGELLMRTIDEDRVSWIAAQYRCKIAIPLATKYVSSSVVAIEQKFIKLIAFTEQVRLRLHYPSWMSGCGTFPTWWV